MPRAWTMGKSMGQLPALVQIILKEASTPARLEGSTAADSNCISTRNKQDEDAGRMKNKNVSIYKFIFRSSNPISTYMKVK